MALPFELLWQKRHFIRIPDSKKNKKKGFHLEEKVARPVWSFNTMNKNNS
jgi:hypothetical protein